MPCEEVREVQVRARQSGYAAKHHLNAAGLLLKIYRPVGKACAKQGMHSAWLYGCGAFWNAQGADNAR